MIIDTIVARTFKGEKDFAFCLAAVNLLSCSVENVIFTKSTEIESKALIASYIKMLNRHKITMLSIIHDRIIFYTVKSGKI